MALENLELEVTANIAKAVAKLEDLQEELQNVAEKIEAVDQIGTEGISIRTTVDGIEDDLAILKTRKEAFEAANKIELDSEVDTNFADLETLLMGGTSGDRSLNDLFDVSGRDTAISPSTAPTEIIDSTRVFSADPDMPSPQDILDRHGDDDTTQNLRKKFKRLGDQATKLRKRMQGFNLRMSDVHNLFASLIPVLFVFVGAVPAVITAVYGLAAAAGTAAAALLAIGGFGALGVALEDGQFNMDNLTEVFDEVREGFIDAFAPLAERLEPLFDDAVDGLVILFEQVAQSGDALMELTDEARAFGGFVMDFLPGALRALAGLVEGLSPLLADIGQAINDNFNSFVRQLVYWTDQAVPVVASLIQTIVAALPTIISMGIQFAAVANEILGLIGLLWQVITVNGALAGGMGYLISTLLLAATAVSLLNKQVFIYAGKALKFALTRLYSFIMAQTAATWAATAQTTALGRLIGALVGFTSSIIKSIAGLFGFTVASSTAAKAAALFWTAVSAGVMIGLLGLVTSMASNFLGLSNSIDQATSSLKEFDRVSGRTSGGFNPYGGDPPSSGAGAATVGSGGGTTINIESSGDPNEDSSNARYVSFKQGRTTGGTN